MANPHHFEFNYDAVEAQDILAALHAEVNPKKHQKRKDESAMSLVSKTLDAASLSGFTVKQEDSADPAWLITGGKRDVVGMLEGHEIKVGYGGEPLEKLGLTYDPKTQLFGDE